MYGRHGRVQRLLPRTLGCETKCRLERGKRRDTGQIRAELLMSSVLRLSLDIVPEVQYPFPHFVSFSQTLCNHILKRPEKQTLHAPMLVYTYRRNPISPASFLGISIHLPFFEYIRPNPSILIKKTGKERGYDVCLLRKTNQSNLRSSQRRS